jgi:hypothetical protein
MNTELVHVSIGELWDKYSILLIKKKKITDIEKLKIINTEINLLTENMNKFNYNNDNLFHNLKNINLKLWNIEDKLRIKELNKEFDTEFITFARNVYIINDKRAECKKEINIKYNSSILEIKEYVKYTIN